MRNFCTNFVGYNLHTRDGARNFTQHEKIWSKQVVTILLVSYTYMFVCICKTHVYIVGNFLRYVLSWTISGGCTRSTWLKWILSTIMHCSWELLYLVFQDTQSASFTEGNITPQRHKANAHVISYIQASKIRMPQTTLVNVRYMVCSFFISLTSHPRLPVSQIN